MLYSLQHHALTPSEVFLLQENMNALWNEINEKYQETLVRSRPVAVKRVARPTTEIAEAAIGFANQVQSTRFLIAFIGILWYLAKALVEYEEEFGDGMTGRLYH